MLIKFGFYGIFLFKICFGQLWPLSNRFGIGQYPGYPNPLPVMDSDYPEAIPIPNSLPTATYPQYGPTIPIGASPSFYSPYSSYRRPYGYAGIPPFGGTNAQDVAMASLINYVYDKDNFQSHGCGWDAGRNRCTDVLNQCKGICKDFANDVVTHDCRCVPFGYAALLGWSTRK
uniref:Uncharacterized protein n=1 Tax=Panagrolaimus sp. JU765 TaxID=591449 RepID=A0AC34QDX7_9BILA